MFDPTKSPQRIMARRLDKILGPHHEMIKLRVSKELKELLKLEAKRNQSTVNFIIRSYPYDVFHPEGVAIIQHEIRLLEKQTKEIEKQKAGERKDARRKVLRSEGHTDK